MIYRPDHTSALGMRFFSKTNAWKMAWYIKIVQGCDCQGSQNEPRQEQLGPEAGWAAAQGRCLTQHCRVGGLPGARTATCRLWIKWHRMGSQASGAQTGFIILRPTDRSVMSVSALAPFFFLAWGKKKKKTFLSTGYLATFFSETYFLLHFQSNILSLQMRKKDIGNKRQRIIF